MEMQKIPLGRGKSDGKTKYFTWAMERNSDWVQFIEEAAAKHDMEYSEYIKTAVLNCAAADNGRPIPKKEKA